MIADIMLFILNTEPNLRYWYWDILITSINIFESMISQTKMRPHVEKKIATILKFGRVIAIFVPLSKIQKRVKKNQERAFFVPFLNRHQKNYYIQFFKPGQNIMSVLRRNIQIPPPLSTGFWHFYFSLLIH